MKRFTVEPTRVTPYIDFDPESNILKLEGQSYPENAFEFYKPIFGWMEEFLDNLQDEEVRLELLIHYLNTSSSKCIMNLFDMLDNAFEEGKNIKINWNYDINNESICEVGEEFQEDLSIPFTITPVER